LWGNNNSQEGFFGLLATLVLLVASSGYAQQSAKVSVALNEQGVARVRAGDYTAAVELFRRAIEQNPNLAVAYNNLGATYNALGRHQEALEVLQNAVNIQPDYAEAHYDLGVAYNNLGRNREAVAAYR